jgi:hypothetical protein
MPDIDFHHCIIITMIIPIEHDSLEVPGRTPGCSIRYGGVLLDGEVGGAAGAEFFREEAKLVTLTERRGYNMPFAAVCDQHTYNNFILK